jgi:hypothetical protein
MSVKRRVTVPEGKFSMKVVYKEHITVSSREPIA